FAAEAVADVYPGRRMLLDGPVRARDRIVHVHPDCSDAAWAVLDCFVEPTYFASRGLVLSSCGIFLMTLTASWFPNGTQTVHLYGLHPLGALALFGAVALQEFRWFARRRAEQVVATTNVPPARAA